ncbi:DUF6406 domain-containing protein [Actinomadura luteofluorescens]|uniref:DUF6406 domain-containing protein n=1 Tax=Actinomadura luteofluorescens TaxID=46163 RepID=UPI0030D3E352
MPRKNVGLRQGTQAHLGGGLSMGLVSVREGRDGAPPEVILFIKDHGEREVTLRPGDTFPFDSQTWKLDRISEAVHNRLGAVFIRIE